MASDWRSRARPIKPGGAYPAKDHCSLCGLCDTYYVAHVKDACAFLGDGMARVEVPLRLLPRLPRLPPETTTQTRYKRQEMEPRVHGRGRDPCSENDTHFGVHEEMLYARKLKPIQGAQWTGVVTSIAMEMLASGKVEAVICVHRYLQ